MEWKKACHCNANDTAQIINVRPLSSTIRVVDDNSLVTDIPAKLKKAIDKIFPKRKNKELKLIYNLIYFLTNSCKNNNPITTHLTKC